MAITVTITRYKSNDDYKDVENGSLPVPELKSTGTVQPGAEDMEPALTDVYTDHSVAGAGTLDDPITLLNDKETLDTLQYYGKTTSGARGYHPLADAVRTLVGHIIESGVQEVVGNLAINVLDDVHQAYITTTTMATLTQVSTWDVTSGTDKIGMFRCIAVVRDLVTDDVVTLHNVMGFDYTDVGSEVTDDNKVITDATAVLELSVSASGYLQARLDNLPFNNKRVHFTFERSVQKYYNYRFPAVVATYTLTGYFADLAVDSISATFEVGEFILNGLGTDLGGVNTMTAFVGIYTVSAYQTNLNTSKVLTADVASFVLTGVETALTKHISMTVAVGAFTITTYAVALYKGTNMVVDMVAFELTGYGVADIRIHIEERRMTNLSSYTVDVTFTEAFTTLPTGIANLRVYRIAEVTPGVTRAKDVRYRNIENSDGSIVSLTGFSIEIDSNESLTGVIVEYLFL